MLENITAPRLTAVRKPRFALGDAVLSVAVYDDKTFMDFGYVVGLEHDPPHCNVKGWWYAVHITQGHFTGYRDYVPEEELVKITFK